MFKSFLEIMRQLFSYADDTKKNTADIKILQADRETTNLTLRQSFRMPIPTDESQSMSEKT